MKEDSIKHIHSKLQAINLRDNYMTQDSLRHVWLLLEVNLDILVDISEPDSFNWNFDDSVKKKISERIESGGGQIAPNRDSSDDEEPDEMD